MIHISKTVEETRTVVKAWKKQGMTVGLVPTMGYLHEGHESLIRQAVAENDRVVVSDFVNPTQFGPKEDLATYPRDMERDSELCQKAGAHLIFHPEPEEMYMPGSCTYVTVEELSKGLCGRTRPVHFRGVCTVVAKLLHIVAPDRAYFGQKDAQQLAIIRRMVRDLNFDVTIVGCPIVRESDGLAKSSRNTYLSEEERKAALVLSRSLSLAQEMLRCGERDCNKLIQAMKEHIEVEPAARIDYIEIVDADSMETKTAAHGKLLCAMAVYMGKTRLIDNFIWEE